MMQVDYRRGSGELLRAIRRAGVEAKETTLPFGDFAFDGNGPHGTVRVGIERKKVSELLGAMHDSRFRRKQVGGMLTTYPGHAWLLVEGVIEPDEQGVLVQGKVFDSRRGNRIAIFHEAGFGVTRHLYENLAKFEITLQNKARLLRTRTISERETVAWLAAIYRWYQKPWADHKSVYIVDETKPDRTLLTPDSDRRRILNQLPNVAWERTKTIEKFMIEHDLSLEEMFAAPTKVWQRALGIAEGLELASAIRRLIRRKPSHDQR